MSDIFHLNLLSSEHSSSFKWHVFSLKVPQLVFASAAGGESADMSVKVVCLSALALRQPGYLFRCALLLTLWQLG